MLVRDGREGLEVFMLRRTLKAVFAGGMYVFPGGAVDDADRSPDVEAWCDGLTDAAGERRPRAWPPAAWRSGSPPSGSASRRPASCWPAGRTVRFVRFDEPEVESRYLAHRSAVHGGAAAAGRPLRRRGPAPGHRRHPLRQPLDHAGRRAPSLRHPVLRRPRPAGPGAAARRRTRRSPASGCAPPTRSPARRRASWR